MKEQYNLKLNRRELLDLEKAMNNLIEKENDSVYYSVFGKVKILLKKIEEGNNNAEIHKR